MQVKKRAAKQKLRDSLLYQEGGDVNEDDGGSKMVKAPKRAWEQEKEDKVKEFKVEGDLKHGVIKDRGCTDILCFLIYFAFIAAMAYCCFVGYSQGNLTKIVAPIDRDHRFCGIAHKDKAGKVEYDYTKYPYLYFPQFRPPTDGGATSFTGLMKSAVCVDKCPGATALDVKCSGSTEYCKGGTTKGSKSTYKTWTLVKFCIPSEGLTTTLKAVWDNMLMILKGGGIGQYLYDVFKAYNVIGICLLTAFLYSLTFIGLLSAFAEPLCWLCIVVVQLGLLGLPGLFGYKYVQTRELLDAPVLPGATPLPAEEKESLEKEASIYLFGAIGVGLLGLCFLACLCCTWKSLKTAINVIDASADFVMVTKRILLVPFVYFLLSMLIIFGWFTGYLMVMSINPINASKHIP